jgi:hypothetical protein
VGWLILSLVALLAPLLWGRRLVQRALPKAEWLDFLRLGKVADWKAARLCSLSGPVGDFVRLVLADPSPGGRVDLVCERLAEVDAETSQLSAQIAMTARTVLAAGGLLSILFVSGAIGKEPAWQVAWGFLPLVTAGQGSFLCYWMGRAASGRVDQRRRNWDALCRVLVRPHMSGPCFAGDAPSNGLDPDVWREDSRSEKNSAMASAGRRYR